MLSAADRLQLSALADRLNFGACMAYAVAVSLRAPLPFKGRDFGQTDVPAHPASIRM